MHETERLKELREQHVRGDRATTARSRMIRRLAPNIRRGSVAEYVAQAGLPPWVLLWLGVTCLVSGGILFGLVHVLGITVATFSVPAVVYMCSVPWISAMRHRRKRHALRQLPSFIEQLVVALRSGKSVDQSMTLAASVIQHGLLRHECERVARLVEVGLPIEKVLPVFVQRIAGGEIELFVLHLIAAVRHPVQAIHALEVFRSRLVNNASLMEKHDTMLQTFMPLCLSLIFLSSAFLFGLGYEMLHWEEVAYVPKSGLNVLVVGQIFAMALLLRFIEVKEH